jgi:hypothetical protein
MAKRSNCDRAAALCWQAGDSRTISKGDGACIGTILKVNHTGLYPPTAIRAMVQAWLNR